MNPLSDSRWISSSLVGGAWSGVPAPYFRRSFTIEKPIASARLLISALGLYEACLNGKTVGDHVLSPGWTDYRKRIPFQAYDVGGLVGPGVNVIGAILGDGWYCGHVAWLERQFYGDRPKLIASLEVNYKDGTLLSISTDASWKTQVGPILLNDLLMGESYDARLDFGNWCAPNFDDSTWVQACELPHPDVPFETTSAPPVRRTRELRAARLPDRLDEYVRHLVRIFDFGQNFSGRTRIRVKAQRGTTVILRHAEVLNSDGSIYVDNLRRARATDIYTCGGAEEETWEPRFTFHGFRYAEISGLRPEDEIAVVGVVLHSDTAEIGSFSCSHPLLNQLHQNIVWGQKGNFLEVPTDCPQRDERLGWTGDAQVFIRTACFNMDVGQFFHKWMQDVRDAQNANGAVPPTAPSLGLFDEDGGPGWSDAIIICPWTVYLCYGDIKIVKDNYAAMHRFMAFLAEHRCKGSIRSHPDVDPWGGFGDWLSMDSGSQGQGLTPPDFIGTAFYAYLAEIMEKISRILQLETEIEHYQQLRHRVVQAFRDRFITTDGTVVSGTQTAYVLALQFGLIPEQLKPRAISELIRNIVKHEYHLTTGFIGTPFLLSVLSDNGHCDVAYRLLEQETFPSWLFPVKNGATTIWERWDGWTPEKGFQSKIMNSFNHYAYGAVGEWMYHTMAGLDLDPEEPGYAHVRFRPRPGGTITWAEARLKTPHGVAAIRWERKEDELNINLTIPPTSRATFVIPPRFTGEVPQLYSGENVFTLRAL